MSCIALFCTDHGLRWGRAEIEFSHNLQQEPEDSRFQFWSRIMKFFQVSPVPHQTWGCCQPLLAGSIRLIFSYFCTELDELEKGGDAVLFARLNRHNILHLFLRGSQWRDLPVKFNYAFKLPAYLLCWTKTQQIEPRQKMTVWPGLIPVSEHW